MIPKPKIEALLNAPPNKVSRIPKIPVYSSCKAAGFTPGNTTKEPNLKITRKPNVARILFLSSSIEKMFFMVVKNFFIELKLCY